MRVLIVEDEPHIAEALVFLLERDGFAVAVVDDGEAAIAALEGCDLLLLDVMLPGRSGFEVAAAALALAAPPKVCVLTARGQAQDRRRMEALGVDAFVTKPFSNQALMTTIRSLVPRSP